MHDLQQLLQHCGLIVQGAVPAGIGIERATDDSRQAGPNVLFVAIPGAKADGHDFLADVAARGGRVALIEREAPAPAGLLLCRVGSTRQALALLAEELAGQPSHAMQVLGITGTNGKTTTTYLLESIIRTAGMRAGVIGTINYRWDSPDGPRSEVANNTTPSPLVIADRMAAMRAAGVGAVAMEVSSHALDQRRADGVRFAAAAFTNLTQDHLDYHQTMEAYIAAKERLFSELLASNPASVAVINIDDEVGRRYAERCRAGRVITYALKRREATLSVDRIDFIRRRVRIRARYEGKPLVIETRMPGFFNTMNCLTAAGLALAAGIAPEAIQVGIAAMPGAPGRFEFVEGGQPFPVIVDYAHTPDALLQVLLLARGFAHKRLIAVFGCGGDRDPGKRPQMGRAAARLADDVIITNDNPRSEQPAAIAAMISEGVAQAPSGCSPRVLVQLDRRKAIRHAITIAREGDAIVLAGKGHEDYQILGSEKIHFDDREEARDALAALGYAG